jgi:hypothetical protein
MLPNHEDPEQLQIRCPSCGQRFKVGSDLRDRTVECGSCEHRFRIDDETILRTKKFYPGERRDPRLDGFARVPHAPSLQPNIQTVQYSEEPLGSSFEPPTPQRTIAAAIGVIGMVFAAMLLIFGARRTGALDGYALPSRLALAGFAGLIGGAMVVYGNPRGRKKALAMALASFAILISLPFFFQEGSEPIGAGVVSNDRPADAPAAAKDDTSELAKTIGLDPLIQENARLAGGEGKFRAVGVWFRQLQFTNKLLVRDYMIRATGADVSSSIYPRDGEDWLMVLSGVNIPIEEIAIIAGKIGHDSESTRILDKLGVVEVVVDNSLFIEGAADKMQDKANPSFFDLNRRELESIDLERCRKAVKRLAEAEPISYRDDITRRLIQLLKEADAPLQGDICRALGTWAQPGDAKATAAAGLALQKLSLSKTAPPREMVEFLVKRKSDVVAPILDGLWAADSTVWEQLYGELGPEIEPLIQARFKSSSIPLKHSAMRLIAKVGAKSSLPLIQSAREGADSEMRVLIERAETAIRARAGS